MCAIQKTDLILAIMRSAFLFSDLDSRFLSQKQNFVCIVVYDREEELRGLDLNAELLIVELYVEFCTRGLLFFQSHTGVSSRGLTCHFSAFRLTLYFFVRFFSRLKPSHHHECRGCRSSVHCSSLCSQGSIQLASCPSSLECESPKRKYSLFSVDSSCQCEHEVREVRHVLMRKGSRIVALKCWSGGLMLCGSR